MILSRSSYLYIIYYRWHLPEHDVRLSRNCCGTACLLTRVIVKRMHGDPLTPPTRTASCLQMELYFDKGRRTLRNGGYLQGWDYRPLSGLSCRFSSHLASLRPWLFLGGLTSCVGQRA